MRQVFAIIILCVAPGTARAQADANPVKSAGDAFGHKRGDEAIGLYDERSVRGFSLEAAGNYRLNGTYFVKNSGVSNFFIDSSTVRIGYNTIGTLLPGPSGVVDYRLRDPLPGEKSLLTVTYDAYGQPIAELNLRHGSPSGRSSYSIGVSRNFDVRNAQGGKGGEDFLVGGIARVSSGATRAQLFAGEYQYRRRGEFRVIPTDSTLPPRIERGNYLGQKWAFDEGQRRIGGLLLDHELTAHSGIGATLSFGQEDPTRSFAQFFQSDGDGNAAGYLVAVPQQRSTAWSSELRSHLEVPRTGATHRFDATVRYRRSTARFGGAQSLLLDAPSLGDRPADIAEPDLDLFAADQRVGVTQIGFGIGYRGAIGTRARINAGLLKSFYSKRFSGPAATDKVSQAPFLYNLGGSFAIAPDFELFGSYSRGLEEAGVAPNSAANRNEILNAIMVKQAEVGLRWSIRKDLSLFLAAFDSRKPYAGVDARDNIYRFIGDVRHRGVEFSLAGRVVPGLQLVAGAVLLDPELTSADDAAADPLRPVAVPRIRGIVNADFAIPGVKGLSVDAGFLHVGARAARSRASLDGTQLKVKRQTTVNAGFRFGFKLGQNDAVVRAQVLNLLNSFAWDVNGSETLAYNEPRRARLLVTVRY